MKMKALMAAVVALGVAGIAMAGEGERRVSKQVVHGGASIEFTAMHNILSELLSAKTGKTQAEIQAMFDKGGPHEVAEKLNLKHEDMKPLFKQARATLIDRSLAANLITSAQAEKLRTAKVEMRHKRMHGPGDGEGDED